MSIETEFLIKQVNVDEALKSAQAKVKSSANKMDNALNGKNTKKGLEEIKKGMQGVNKMGGKAGGVLKNVTDAISGMITPIGLITTGLTAIVAVGTAVWDKLTVSADQYAKKLGMIADDSNKKLGKSLKQMGEEQGYMQTLRNLSKVENLSNAEKMQAVQIIDILTTKYGDLGLAIDQATGKIIGFDDAQKQLLKKQQEIKVKQAETYAYDEKRRIDPTLTKGTWSWYAPRTWWQSDNEAIARQFGVDYLTYKGWETSPNKDKINDKRFLRLETWKSGDLEKQLKIATEMRDEATTDADINRWNDVKNQIEKALAAKLKADIIKKTGATGNAEAVASMKKSTQTIRKEKDSQQSLAEQKNTLAENNKIAGMKANEKNDYYIQKDIDYQDQLAQEQNALSAMEDAYNKLMQQKNKLEKIGKLDDNQQQQLVNLNKQLLTSEADIETKKTQISKIDLERLQNLAKIEQYERAVKKYYEEKKTQLDNDIATQALVVKGKYEQAERQKVINDLKKQGLRIDQNEVDEIMKKRKALAGLNIKKAFKSQAEALIKQVGMKINPNQAEYEDRVKKYEQQYGVKLNQQQKDNIRDLIRLEGKIKDQRGIDLKSMEIKTNDLTRRGGFATGAWLPSSQNINQQIRDYTQQNVRLLQDIKNLMRQVGII